MKIPRTPPSFRELMNKANFEEIVEFLSAAKSARLKDRYLHWDKLIRYQPPEGLTHEIWWLGLKLSRTTLYKDTPLCDRHGRPFRYTVSDPIPERLHQIDQQTAGRIGVPDPITNPETKDQYYVHSLIEEAVTSSQLEGATTTRKVAKEMIRENRRPRDRSEQMILNNFQTMQRIGKLREEKLSRDLVLELHRLVTHATLDDESAAGRFRRTDERIVVEHDTQILHVPPSADELEERMSAMCEFANGLSPDHFMHPALRSVILHFWLAYDHPFVDGNGRTARALFYWSMLHYGFWMFEFISVSSILRKAPAKYARAFLYTETDDNDLTYFVLYQMDVVQRAIGDLSKYIDKKVAELKAAEQCLQGMVHFNYRQRALLSHALRHPHHQYSIEGHRRSHNVTHETARHDLRDLEKRGLLTLWQVGKTLFFAPAPDIQARLEG